VRRDYGVTFAVTAIGIVAYLLTLRLVAHQFGGTAFGAYALVRRTVSVMAPLTILGADYATARFVAFAEGHGRASKPYLPAALVVMTTSTTIAAIVLVLFRGTFADLLFGAGGYVSLVLVLPPLLLGLGLYSVAYNYLRGRSRFLPANLLTVVIQAVVPVASVYAGGSVARILLVMAFSWITISLGVLARMPMSLVHFRSHLREVIRYGAPRAPGDLLQLALFAAPSVFAAHWADLRTAGLVALGTSALSMVGSALSPVSFILLPVSARMLGAGQIERLRRHVWRLSRLLIVCVFLGTLVVELFATPLVNAYLGPDFGAGVYVVRIMLLASLPYALFTALRSVVDARHLRAINTRNMVLATACFTGATLVVSLFGLTIPAVLADFVLSIYVLGALTVWEAAKVFRQGTATALSIEAEPNPVVT
jgi:O-antigen/teichoic acid export membrane protein